MFINAVVDAHEGRYVDIFETPGAYLCTETYEDVIIFLMVELSDEMFKVSPKIYLKYSIMSSKGKLILHF